MCLKFTQYITICRRVLIYNNTGIHNTMYMAQIDKHTSRKYDYDYDYEMLLLKHKEIQYNMS